MFLLLNITYFRLIFIIYLVRISSAYKLKYNKESIRNLLTITAYIGNENRDFFIYSSLKLYDLKLIQTNICIFCSF